jgi:mRNA-degrading endonuclease HigB of HigAB toxin-antitoxin module
VLLDVTTGIQDFNPIPPTHITTIWSIFNVHGSVYRIDILFHIIPTRYKIHRIYFYLTTALHVPNVTITHRPEHKTTVTTASGNRYTVIYRVKFTDKEYR